MPLNRADRAWLEKAKKARRVAPLSGAEKAYLEAGGAPREAPIVVPPVVPPVAPMVAPQGCSGPSVGRSIDRSVAHAHVLKLPIQAGEQAGEQAGVHPGEHKETGGSTAVVREFIKRGVADADARRKIVAQGKMPVQRTVSYEDKVIRKGRKFPGKKSLKGKTRRLNMTFTEQEYRMLEIAAKKMGRTLSDAAGFAISTTYQGWVVWK